MCECAKCMRIGLRFFKARFVNQGERMTKCFYWREKKKNLSHFPLIKSDQERNKIPGAVICYSY